MNDNQYKHPNRNLLSGVIEKACNSHVFKAIRRNLFKRFPFLKMKSEVKNIVYINWLVDLKNTVDFVPGNVSLININGKTLLSVLSYQHGHFRPSLLSLIRYLFPSPLQSNWRFYVSKLNHTPTTNTVLFIKNIMSSVLYAIGTRLFSDAMQTHLAKTYVHFKDDNGISTLIKKGVGSSPNYTCNAQYSDSLKIPGELSEYFGNNNLAITYICLQDFALSEGNDFKGLCKAEIKLPINTNNIIPLIVKDFECDWLNNIIGDAEPFAFLVPSVDFEVLNEQLV